MVGKSIFGVSVTLIISEEIWVGTFLKRDRSISGLAISEIIGFKAFCSVYNTSGSFFLLKTLRLIFLIFIVGAISGWSIFVS